jgi:hypothetical protein
MGYLWRVRLSSFLAGAATASAAGFFLLYKDHLVARAAITRQVSPLPHTAPLLFVRRLHLLIYFDTLSSCYANSLTHLIPT